MHLYTMGSLQYLHRSYCLVQKREREREREREGERDLQHKSYYWLKYCLKRCVSRLVLKTGTKGRSVTERKMKRISDLYSREAKLTVTMLLGFVGGDPKGNAIHRRT